MSTEPDGTGDMSRDLRPEEVAEVMAWARELSAKPYRLTPEMRANITAEVLARLQGE